MTDRLGFCLVLFTTVMASVLLAGRVAAAVPGDVSADRKAGVPLRNKGPRKLAPGVLTVIPPVREEEETFSGPREVVEIVHGIPKLDWTPHYTPKSETIREIARRTIFRREIWHLEFAFKPLRMIYVDIPQPSGKMQRKRIWYLVYRVKNSGSHMSPVAKEDDRGYKTYSVEPVNHSLRFFPQFVLEGREFDKAYMDRVIPVAVSPIQRREDPNTRLYNTVQISSVDIKVGTERSDRSVWGVATWQDLDPRIDFFSIYVTGLTNAYRWEDPAGAYKAGDAPGTGRKHGYKTLQLNFWRAGDAVNLQEEETRYGVPIVSDPAEQAEVLEKYGIQTRLDHLWVYR